MNQIDPYTDLMVVKPSIIVDNEYPIDKIILSHSSRSTFRSCARKFEFFKFYTAMVESEDDFPAQVGTALHRGFQTWLQTQDEDAALFEMALAYPHDLEYSDKNGQRSLEACVHTLQMMMDSHLIQPYEIAKIVCGDGVTRDAIEVPFAIKIVGAPSELPIWYVGFIDCILFNRIEQKYVVVDIKSTRQHLIDFEPRYRYDEQCIPYGIVLEHALGHEISEIDVAYLSCYIDLETPKINLYNFTRDQDAVHDWLRGLCEDVDRICRYHRTKWFPRTTDGQVCISWNRPCAFTDVCYERNVSVLKRMLTFSPREGLFHTGQEPWISVELGYSLMGENNLHAEKMVNM